MLLNKDNLPALKSLIHWKNEAPKWCTNIFAAPLRARQHASSRKALVEILKTKNIVIDISTIDIENNHNIKGHPDQLCSLSHTKDGWAVGLIAESEDIFGVGIDLEFVKRSFNPETKKLFVNAEDVYKDLLSLWCQKEAAFKAISPLLTNQILDKVFVLKDIFIRDNQFGLVKDGKILGYLDTEIVSKEDQEFLITSAFVTLKPI